MVSPTSPPSSPQPSAGPIVQAGAAVLRTRASDVPLADIGTPAFQSLVARMVAAMRAAPGVGLAAPQIGVPLRVLVLEDHAALMAKLTPAEIAARGRVAVPLRVAVNPIVTPIGSEQASFFEGCLSVSGYTALVSRHLEVEVAALDEKGAPFTWRVRGWPARILQHEIDHLDGTLYIDRMNSRSFSTSAQVQERFAGKAIEEVRASFD